MIIPFIIEVNGLQVSFHMDLDPAIPHEAYLLDHYNRRHCYEPEVVRVLMRTLKPGDVAIDVGANAGFFTLMMSALVRETGRVHAFEPVKESFARLKANVEFQAAKNVIRNDMPLSAEFGAVDFYENVDDAAGSALWNPGLWHENPRSKATPKMTQRIATTIDTVFDSPVKLIKIDTEGAEHRILEGASKLLSRHKTPYIIAELNPFGMKQLGSSDESLRHYMRRYGYDMFFIHGDDRMPTYVTPPVKVKYIGDWAVKNVLFSTMDAVAKAWPEALE